jgi:hypothetical protein
VKLKAAISGSAPEPLFEILGSRQFVRDFLNEIVTGCFGIEDPADRPAEYYVQLPDRTLSLVDNIMGVEVRLTGVSRGNRPPKVFHDALKKLEELVIRTIQEALRGLGFKVEVFVVIMLDKDVPLPPKAGSEFTEYTSVLESEAKWVTDSSVDIVILD